MKSLEALGGGILSPSSRLAITVAVLALGATMAVAEDLRVVYSDGQSETVPVVPYEGVEHVAYKSLDHMLHRVDAGATLVHEYNPNNLRLVVAGKTVSIQEAFVLVENRIFRPFHPLQVVNGEFLIPVDTLMEIKSSLGLFDLAWAPPPGQAPASQNVIIPPEEPAAAASLPALETGAVPPGGFSAAESQPAGEAGEGEAFGLTIPKNVREIASADLATLLRRAPLRSIASVALAPEGAEPAAQGSYAPVIQSICAQVAARAKTLLEETKRFSVRIPNQPVTPKTVARTVEWANNSQCDVLVALTVDVSPNRNLSGMRIWTAHEAGDASFRPIEKGGAYGLPASFNYIPHEQYSLLLASLISAELSKALHPPAHSVETAPSYLLRRVAMPSVSVSLGYASTDSERKRMATDEFVDETARALARALARMQEMNLETLHAG